MTGALNLQSLAQLSAERIINCTAEGIVIALLAWLLLRAIGPRNSGTRFAVWFAALLGIAALPLFGHWVSTSAGLAKPSGITMPSSSALYIFAAWLLLAAAGLFRVAIGFLHLHRLRRSCVLVDLATLDPLLQKTLADFDSSRAVKLCVSDQMRVPTAIGFTKPLVVIPTWALEELSPLELNAILLHELAHLARRDDWSNLIQKILGALLFFHPAVWWIEKKLALEREMACDDLVLAETETTSPGAYAECLVSLAEKSFLRRGFALAQTAVDRLRHVSLRVTQILDANRPQATRVWRPAPVLVSGASLVCLIALSHAPVRLVSFEGDAASPSAMNAIAGNFDANQRSNMGVRVSPARLQVRGEAFRAEEARGDQVRPEHKASAAVAKSAVKPLRPTRKAGTVSASAVQQGAKAPALVRTSLEGDSVTSQSLFLLMQTEVLQTRQYDASGALVWDLCVWRVTVVGPVRSLTQAEIVAKSI